MPSAAHKKVKERIALAIRIKNLNKEAETCSRYRRNSCQCLVDLKESSKYSEYVRSKRPYNSQGLKKPFIILKQVCRFFISLMRRKAPLLKPDSSCLLAFKLDFATFSNALDFVRELPELPLFDPNNPF